MQRSGESFRFGDSHSYWIIASNLARGEPYQFGSENSKIFRSPLYPILLAPWTWIGPGNPSSWGVWMARLMGCFLGCGAVACIMWMTRNVASPTVALIAGILASIYPGAIAMSIFILSEAIATPMFTLSCACVLWGLREPSRGRSALIAAGVAFGLSCLARPSWSLWPLVLFSF
ncbi:MAG: phospholipid carrier-dependent glycosyltransferase, partial [Planctomycetota bacterium]